MTSAFTDPNMSKWPHCNDAVTREAQAALILLSSANKSAPISINNKSAKSKQRLTTLVNTDALQTETSNNSSNRHHHAPGA